MEVPLAELLDRLVIVRLKKERISGSEKEKEYEFYMKELENYRKKGYEVREEWLEKLYEVNGKIWDLEADIRAGKDGELGLEEVGKRAIEIRNLNRIRIQIKNKIVGVTGSGFRDVKVNHASEEDSLKMISIVITSFREPKTIGKAIESFINQDIKEKYELVISAPDEETLDVVKEYQKKNKNIKIFKDPGKGKAYALNLLLPTLKGDIIIFSDGDVYVSENSINEILRFFEDEEIGCVSGRPVAVNGKNKMVDYFSNLLLDAGAHKIRFEFDKKNKFLECTGYLFAIKNTLIKEIPHLDVAEDSVIPYLIWKQGYKISYVSEAKVYVKYPSNLGDFIRQRKRAGVGSHSKLTKYYNDFPRMKSFTNEIRKGFFWALKYPQNLKEFFWTLALFPIRLYIWFIYYFEAFFKKKSYQDAWERVESTK